MDEFNFAIDNDISLSSLSYKWDSFIILLHDLKIYSDSSVKHRYNMTDPRSYNNISLKKIRILKNNKIIFEDYYDLSVITNKSKNDHKITTKISSNVGGKITNDLRIICQYPCRKYHFTPLVVSRK